MKKKGRYVVEAAFLIPGISLLIVYMVFFSLYVHDYVVCAHAVLECGVRSVYPDGRSNQQLERDTERELKQKLGERLLWLQDEDVDVQVNPVWLELRISGTGNFLPVEGISLEQKVYRIHPCETIRRSRWLTN